MDKFEIASRIRDILSDPAANVTVEAEMIEICSEDTVTIKQLQELSHLLGTERIDIVPTVYHPGYSEYTPSWTEDGSIKIYPANEGDKFEIEPPKTIGGTVKLGGGTRERI